MKITFPHLGNLYLSLKAIFAELKIDVVEPPPISQKTYKIGTKYSPEGACLPFKLVLGNFIEALEKGADSIITLGGSGPCRFGYYGYLQQKILLDLGYSPKMFIIDGANIKQVLMDIRRETGVSWGQIIKGVKLAWEKLKAADAVEKAAHQVWPFNFTEVLKIYTRSLSALEEADTFKEIREVKVEFLNELGSLGGGGYVPRIGLVGDIYMLLEPGANYNIEKFLGQRGIEVHRSIYLSDWVVNNLIPTNKNKHKKALMRKSLPYLKYQVGGHGLDTVANTLNYGHNNFDGIIHIFPMTCTPEIVAQTLLNRIKEDLRIPVLTLVLDEHSGVEAIKTRLEAFIDLITSKKDKEIKNIY